jgi:hypothetical protein
MFNTRRLGAIAPVIAALAVGAPAAVAATATPSAADPVISGPTCPANYTGPTNLATGCPYWLMTYTVAYPGRPAFHCPVQSADPPVYALSSARVFPAPPRAVMPVGRCSVVATAG